MHHVSCATCPCPASHNGIAVQTDTRHVHTKSLAKASPNGSKFETRRRRHDDDRRRETTRDDDRRRETTTDDERRRHDASHANTCPTPTPPTINGNPSLRIREKTVTNVKVDCVSWQSRRTQHRASEKPKMPPAANELLISHASFE